MTSNNTASAPSSGSSTPNPRFVSQNTAAEDLLKNQTVGLVHLDDFRKRRAEAIDSGSATPGSSASELVFKKKKRKTATKGGLSFAADDEAEDGETTGIPVTNDSSTKAVAGSKQDKKRLAANTNVGFQAKSMSKTALLREAQTKEQLRKEFLVMQDRVKATEFILPFVFYAGRDIPGGTCRMKKGDLVWLFLDRARKVGAEVSGSDRSRREWARVSVDDLILVRGDLIIPHHYDFHHFMQNKTIGYSGPLFPHSAEPTSASPTDVSTPSTPGGLSVPDPTAAKATTTTKPQPQASSTIPDSELEGFGADASLTKVVDRRWYEKHKHIYPASTWEEFDATRDYSSGVRKDTSGNTFFFAR